ncbi:MAG: MMPL family transporter [Elusimicrobiota bacterium]
MKKIISFVMRQPKSVFIGLLAVSLAAATQLPKLTINVGADGLMVSDDPNRAFYEETQSNFGSDNITVIFVEDKDLFTPEKLAAVQSVAGALEDVEGVIKVDSLFTLKNFKHSEGGLESTPFFEEVPDSEEAIEELRLDALRNPLIARNVISADGTAMAINVYVRNDAGVKDFDAKLSGDIEQAIAPLREQVGKVFQMGMPFTRDELSGAIINDQKLITPLAVGALIVALALGLGTFNGAIVPMLTAGLSILWTLGFMGLVGLPINMLTGIVPALIIVIGSTEDIHLLSEYAEGVAEGLDRPNAIMYMAGKLGLAIFLTFITTYLGFFSVALNKILILKQFGAVASSGLLFNFMITITVVPLYLGVFGKSGTEKKEVEKEGEKKEEGGSVFAKSADILLEIIRRNRTGVLVGAAVISVVIGAGAFKVRVNNNSLGYFKEDSQVRVRANTLAERLTGMQSFYVVLKTENGEAFKDPQLLAEIKKVQDFIKQMKLFDASFSLVDLLSLINREMNSGGEEHSRIPASTELINQYLAVFLSSDDTGQYVTADYSTANILVRHHLSASYDLTAALKRLKEFTDTLDKRIEVRVTGEEILTNTAADSMASGQAKSLSSLILIIFVMISIVFLNAKAGLLSLIPNVIPICVLFGLMGYLNIPLDVGTAMIAVIAIGIAMDDTVHFMVRYNKEVRATADEKTALENTVRAEVTPVISTSIALALGFGVLMASSFVPIIYFGALTALMMVVALLSDLLVTPMLLTTVRFVTLWDMVACQVGKKVISKCPLFKDMRTWQIKQIILMSKVREVPSGETFIKQGAMGHEMFVVLEGHAKAEKVAADGKRRLLGAVGEGDVIGEIALVSKEERMADVVAESDMRLLVLEWKALEQLGRYLPMISTRLFLNISRIIGKRLAAAK